MSDTPHPFELLPHEGMCLYDRERELLAAAREAAAGNRRLELPYLEVPALVDALESLGRIRHRRLEQLGGDVPPELLEEIAGVLEQIIRNPHESHPGRPAVTYYHRPPELHAQAHEALERARVILFARRRAEGRGEESSP